MRITWNWPYKGLCVSHADGPVEVNTVRVADQKNVIILTLHTGGEVVVPRGGSVELEAE